MEDDVVGSIAKLEADAAPLVKQSFHSRYEALAPAYSHLVARIESASEAVKREIAIRLQNMNAASTESLGSYFLFAAKVRALVGNPANWRPAAGLGWVPKAELVAELNGLIESGDGTQNPYLQIAKGIHSFLVGRDAQAYADFYLARENPYFWQGIRDDFKGAATCRPLPTLLELDGRELPFQVGAIEWMHSSQLGTEPYVVCFYCDDLYFRAFAPHIISSLDNDSTGLSIHFHVINPSEPTAALVATLADACKKLGAALQVSSERSVVPDRAYFASARFLRLREFIGHFKRSVLLLDTDSEFKSDPRTWCRGFFHESVNCLFVKGPWGNGYLPWRSVWAGMIYVPSNPAGLFFADTLRQVIAYLWDDKREANWWIDQNALYMTYRVLQRYWATDGFKDIPKERYDQIRTGEALKLQRLSAQGQVSDLMQKSGSWVEALRNLQLKRQD